MYATLKDTVSVGINADDFVGIWETPEGLQKQIERALEYTRKWSESERTKVCTSSSSMSRM